MRGRQRDSQVGAGRHMWAHRLSLCDPSLKSEPVKELNPLLLQGSQGIHSWGGDQALRAKLSEVSVTLGVGCMKNA